jgi:hypothetical protein
VKLSSWPTAQNATYLIDTLRAFGAIAARLGKSRRRRSRAARA